MTRGEIIDEYRRMNSEDQKTFRRWLINNTVVGAVSILGLIAITSIFSGSEPSSAAAQNDAVVVHAEAK
jgi:hypothetical protein